MGLLIDAVSGPWYGSGWDGIALVVLAMIAAVTAAMAGWRLSLSD
jgi:hypothetical protein